MQPFFFFYILFVVLPELKQIKAAKVKTRSFEILFMMLNIQVIFDQNKDTDLTKHTQTKPVF